MHIRKYEVCLYVHYFVYICEYMCVPVCVYDYKRKIIEPETTSRSQQDYHNLLFSTDEKWFGFLTSDKKHRYFLFIDTAFNNHFE